MLKTKRSINQQDSKIVDYNLSNPNNFQLFGVVDRVSETQLQVGENPNKFFSGQRVNPYADAYVGLCMKERQYY